MRTTDAVMAFPGLVLAIALTAVLEQPGLLSVIIVLTAVRWTSVARLVRGQVLSLREAEHIAAIVALGAGKGRIIFRHLLPNCLAPILVAMTFGVASNILAEAGLGFLGLGIQPPMVSWGSLLAEGRLSHRQALAVRLSRSGNHLYGSWVPCAGRRAARCPGSASEVLGEERKPLDDPRPADPLLHGRRGGPGR